MIVTFEFFGVLERLAGASTLQLTLPADARTVAEALSALARAQPDLADSLERSACAVGDTLVLRSTPLAPDARLALLPPVAGG